MVTGQGHVMSSKARVASQRVCIWTWLPSLSNTWSEAIVPGRDRTIPEAWGYFFAVHQINKLISQVTFLPVNIANKSNTARMPFWCETVGAAVAAADHPRYRWMDGWMEETPECDKVTQIEIQLRFHFHWTTVGSSDGSSVGSGLDREVATGWLIGWTLEASVQCWGIWKFLEKSS